MLYVANKEVSPRCSFNLRDKAQLITNYYSLEEVLEIYHAFEITAVDVTSRNFTYKTGICAREVLK